MTSLPADRPPVPEPLPDGVEVADSHCHLDLGHGVDFGDALPVPDAIAQAREVGVSRIVQIGCDLPGARWAVSIAQQHPEVVAGVSLHPNEGPRLVANGAAADLQEELTEIDSLAGHERVRAVGETGLDYYRTGESGRDVQHAAFRAHIEMAKRHGKALVIHDRDAHDDVLRVLAEEGPPDRVVFHCFSGDVDMARACVRQGFWLSFAGTVTFKNAAVLRNALAVTPLDRLLVETDAPFLAPVPYRGRPNASYLIPHTLRAMAEVTSTTLEELAGAIAANTEVAFGRW